MNNSARTDTTITVLVLSGATMLTLASVIDPLRATNRLSDDVQFRWRIVSPDSREIELSGGLPLTVSDRLQKTDKGNILIVVASFDHHRFTTPDLIKTLRLAAQNFETVCGIEAGSWLLARAGLADGRRITTHWEDLDKMQEAYLETDVCNERFVVDGKIWTCGGASPALDMMLHLIEQVGSPQLALEVASVFVYDQLHVASDPQPTLSLGKLEKNEPRVAAAIRKMETHIEDPITTAVIAKETGVSPKTLEKLFDKFLQETPGAYYLKLRLQMARKLVTDTNGSMQEIAVQTGFSSQSAFSRSFKRRYNTSPSQLRHTPR